MPEQPFSPEDPLAVLSAHVRGARDAAEHLARQAGATPPSGWEVPGVEQTGGSEDELKALVELVGSLRELLPEDLGSQLADLLRQLLVLLRVLIDLLVERLEHNHRPAVRDDQVQDIPIL